MKTLIFILISLTLMSCGQNSFQSAKQLERNFRQPLLEITYTFLEEMVFAPRCFKCHGEDVYKKKGKGVALYRYEQYAAEAADVWKEIRKDKMPKDDPKLNATEKSWVKEWVDNGTPK
jgi:hypothetical protein